MAVFCEVIIIIIDHCLDWLLIYWFTWHRNFTSSSLCPLQIGTKSARHSFDDLLMPESKCIDQLPALWSYIYCSFMSLKWNILTYFLTAYYHLEQLVIGYSTKNITQTDTRVKKNPDTFCLFLSPSGDRGIGQVSYYNHPIHPVTFWLECWNLRVQTELNYIWWDLSCPQEDVRWFQMFHSCFQMILRCFQMIHRCSQMFSDDP